MFMHLFHVSISYIFIINSYQISITKMAEMLCFCTKSQGNWEQGLATEGSWNALLESAIKSRPVMQTPVLESTEIALRDSVFVLPQPDCCCLGALGAHSPVTAQSDHILTIKYSFIKSVLRSSTPLQKHVLFSLTYSTGDANQQWHCHLWAMQYDSLVVQMSDYTVQY